MNSRGPVAAIDCGTNSTRLLVVDEHGRPLERLMRITRLGEGVDATGKLSVDAIDRCVAVLSEYRQVMTGRGVVRARMVATSAARDASNGPVFLAAAAEATGVTPELLSGREEGALSMAGAVAELDPGDGPFLVVDIGGGSTELVVGSGPADGDHDVDVDVASLQMGCVRLSERYLTSDPPLPGELAAAEAMVVATLEEAIAAHPRLLDARRLVGLAGTVSTLSSLAHGLATYERNRVHHSVLTGEQVLSWYRTLAAEDRTARLARTGMVKGREDVIVGGAMILHLVMARFQMRECLVSEADILDGMVAGQLAG
ncbi:MAG TPA: Ppx/GppA phosphatase family protein [Acidimicrobiales bacterium]|nr:Ppx/GppA phosphatase family protein [Acidimicrobiales bacterium]